MANPSDSPGVGARSLQTLQTEPRQGLRFTAVWHCCDLQMPFISRLLSGYLWALSSVRLLRCTWPFF